jgi:hypothetical protein
MRPTARVVRYRGYTITRAYVFDGTAWQANGWDVSVEGADWTQPANTLAEAKAWLNGPPVVNRPAYRRAVGGGGEEPVELTAQQYEEER